MVHDPTYDPTEVNPMWGPRPASTSAPVGALLCRIALPTAEMRALLEGVPSVEVPRTPTADAPLVLLADDDALAERLRGAGVRVPRAAGSYAERQWDAREAAETTAHRMFDHGEIGSGVTNMAALQHRSEVALASGAERAGALLARLLDGPEEVARAGLVVDARDPRDLRVFALPALERGRCIVVRADSLEDHAADADRTTVEAALRALVRDALRDEAR